MSKGRAFPLHTRRATILSQHPDGDLKATPLTPLAEYIARRRASTWTPKDPCAPHVL